MTDELIVELRAFYADLDPARWGPTPTNDPLEEAREHGVLDAMPEEVRADPERRIQWIKEWHERFIADLQRVVKMQYGHD